MARSADFCRAGCVRRPDQAVLGVSTSCFPKFCPVPDTLRLRQDGPSSQIVGSGQQQDVQRVALEADIARPPQASALFPIGEDPFDLTADSAPAGSRGTTERPEDGGPWPCAESADGCPVASDALGARCRRRPCRHKRLGRLR